MYISNIYNAENFSVSFFNKVASIFHLGRGGNQKKFFWAYVIATGERLWNHENAKADGNIDKILMMVLALIDNQAVNWPKLRSR